MKQLFYIILFLLILACSNAKPLKTNEQITVNSSVNAVEVSQEITPPQQKKMSTDKLQEYFQRSKMQDYTNCHSEKGPTQDFFDGKLIPIELAINYKLYKASMSPQIAMKHKKDNKNVSYRGIRLMEINEKQVFVYGIGINMEGDEITDVEMVEIRVLVLSRDGEIESNYFLGGYEKIINREEKFVCRKMSYNSGQLIFDLNPTSFNVPSSLRLDQQQKRDI